MGLSAAQAGYPELPVVGTPENYDLTQALTFQSAGIGATAVYPTAALGIFIPFRLTQRRTYLRAWWLNGSAVAGNADLGVYTVSGTTATRLQSIGSTAQAGVSTIQTVTINWTFDPGLYYLGFSHSEATTGQYWRAIPNAVVPRFTGLYQAATQSPLAATATMVLSFTAYVPACGLSELAVI